MGLAEFFSPSGQRAVPYEGPLRAELVVVGESPARDEVEQGRPFVGRAGRVLDVLLNAAGLPRDEIRIVNAVPTRAPGDKFAQHSPEDLAWGLALLETELKRAVSNGARLLMPLGDNPLRLVAGELPYPPKWGDEERESEVSRIGAWRGSLFPLDNRMQTIADYRVATTPDDKVPWVLPTYHPAAIARRFEWHELGIIDFKRAAAFLRNDWKWPKRRRWSINRPDQLLRIVQHIIEVERCYATDTENSPYPIGSIVTEEEVHVFDPFDTRTRKVLQHLFDNDALFVAHNTGHDLTQYRQWGYRTPAKYVDTSGFAHILNCSLPRNLSPGISTRFTNWPYHKHLVETDPKMYNGLDSVICYDAYWEQLGRLSKRELLGVAEHDHKLLRHLMQMQWRGVLIDEEARVEAVEEAEVELREAQIRFRALGVPVVLEKLESYVAGGRTPFKKPHLFFERQSCSCCHGKLTGEPRKKTTRCWSCAKFKKAPTKKMMEERVAPKARYLIGSKAELEATILEPCRQCDGRGRHDVWLEVKPSDDQLADILYRGGFGIRPRRYKGKETVRADQLDPLRADYPIVEAACQVSEAQSVLTTMKRLEPDVDGRLHSTFDPWGTPTGRVASREGMIQRGTNSQNVPVSKRYVFIADEGRQLVAPDLEQVEGRCIAVVSNDPALRRAYSEPIDWPSHERHGQIDSHTLTQQLVYEACGVMLSRDQAKRWSYAEFYGVEPKQLMVEMNAERVRKGEGAELTLSQTLKANAAFWRTFAGVKRWRQGAAESVQATRKLRSPTGRERVWLGYILDLRTKKLKKKIPKEVTATQPQDMGAWVLALGLDALMREQASRSKLLVEPLIHVHDELVHQIPVRPGRLVDEALELIRRSMTVEEWGMQFPCDVGQPAPNWACAKGEHRYNGGVCRGCGRHG